MTETETAAKKIAANRTGSRFMKFIIEENAFFMMQIEYHKNLSLGRRGKKWKGAAGARNVGRRSRSEGLSG